MTEIISHNTAESIAQHYAEATKNIRNGLMYLQKAYQELKQYLECPTVIPPRFAHYDFNTQEAVEDTVENIRKKLKADTWLSLVRTSGIDEVMTEKTRRIFEQEVERDKTPEITAENIIKVLSRFTSNVPVFAKEFVEDAVRALHPRFSKLKTNKRLEIEKKVIVEYGVEFFCGSFVLSMCGKKTLKTIDNAFHLLDGKGVAKYPDDLVTQVKQALIDKKGTCETEYFSCKWYRNGNIHVAFKRLDLVEQLNRVWGRDKVKEGI